MSDRIVSRNRTGPGPVSAAVAGAGPHDTPPRKGWAQGGNCLGPPGPNRAGGAGKLGP
jgi:hypothetical protein